MHALAGSESIQHRLGAAWADANAGLTLVRYPGEFQNTADDLQGRLASARQDSGGREGEPLAALSDDEAVKLAHDLVSFYERIMEYQLPR